MYFGQRIVKFESVHFGLLIQKYLVISHLRYAIICSPVLTRLKFDIQTFYYLSTFD